ncbi:MAG: protein kinase, partial [Mogibacterium sp.]|nr:protein kinase [Mogibacterium sp.]
MEERTITQWHDWKVTKFLGAGAYGKVYQIEREAFGHTYRSALKVLRIPQNEQDFDSVLSTGMSEEDAKVYFYEMVEAISKEFALMSELKGNSNIVSFEDFEVVPSEDGHAWDIYIRMELLEPFTQYMKKAQMTKRDVLHLGIDICKALELCEQKNIIHRDIKPENIFRSEQGTFKLGDFGIARELDNSSQGMSRKGTISYMAPEIYRGVKYGHTVDIYSLGIMLYRLMNNNRIPFLPPYPTPIKYTDTEQANLMRITGREMEPPCNAKDALGDIILKACAYDPEDRYQHAFEMRQALEDYLAAQTVRKAPQAEETEDDGTVHYPKKAVATASAAGVAAAAVPEAEPQKPVPPEVSAVPDKTPETPVKPEVFESTEEDQKKSIALREPPKPEVIEPVKPAVSPEPAEVQPEPSIAPPQVFTPEEDLQNERIGGEVKAPVEEPTVKPAETAEKSGKKLRGRQKKAKEPKPEKDTGKGRKKSKTGLIIVAALAVLLIGVAYFLLFPHGGEMEFVGSRFLKDTTYVSAYTSEITAEDIRVLNKFKDCNKVYFYGCDFQEGSIEAFAEIKTGIQQIQFKDCTGINSIAPLNGLPMLGILDFKNCGITDSMLQEADLGSFPYLAALSLEKNEGVTSLEPIKGLIPQLQGLILDDTKVKDISLLKDAKEMRAFSAVRCGISDISALANCPLEDVDLRYNKISDIAPLAKSQVINHILISDNEVEDLSPLSGLEELTIFMANGNKISDITPLAGCPKLRELALCGNEIESLEGLAGHESLVEFYINDNHITSLKGLENELVITTLAVAHNDLTSLEGATNCT